MEPIRLHPNEFKLTNFINYYKDNYDELLSEYPNYVSRICLIDKDYMDVVTFDEDYEELSDANDYEELLLSEQYALHFVIGKTTENQESVEFIDGKTQGLKHYIDDVYEEDVVKDIGDLNLDLDHLIGLLFDIEEDDLIISVVNFEHGGEMSTPRIIEVDDCGDLDETIKNFINRFM
ncbi:MULTISPECIES: hypothetical protein [unclassified Romboutsia]|uniref:hypothetical protein n=1 Tax=unclassified Romboutsia TaxID=2626894 RepID=UPI000821F6BA|nr:MULTISPECIES: hypothetical protein [unclassified Romboutsia]SCH66800.1 Uncharacterised protein [uncultured Clostridium sp.]